MKGKHQYPKPYKWVGFLLNFQCINKGNDLLHVMENEILYIIVGEIKFMFYLDVVSNPINVEVWCIKHLPTKQVCCILVLPLPPSCGKITFDFMLISMLEEVNLQVPTYTFYTNSCGPLWFWQCIILYMGLWVIYDFISNFYLHSIHKK